MTLLHHRATTRFTSIPSKTGTSSVDVVENQITILATSAIAKLWARWRCIIEEPKPRTSRLIFLVPSWNMYVGTVDDSSRRMLKLTDTMYWPEAKLAKRRVKHFAKPRNSNGLCEDQSLWELPQFSFLFHYLPLFSISFTPSISTNSRVDCTHCILSEVQVLIIYLVPFIFFWSEAFLYCSASWSNTLKVEQKDSDFWSLSLSLGRDSR